MPDIVQLLKELRASLRELGRIEKALKALGGVPIGGKAKRRKPKFSKAGQARRTKIKTGRRK
jgi:hypothetical protein